MIRRDDTKEGRRPRVGRFEQVLLAGAFATAVLGFGPRAEAQQCNQPADITGAVALYTVQGSSPLLDKFSGEVENQNFEALGYVASKYPQTANVLAGIFLMKSPSGSPVDNQNWRNVKYVATSFGGNTKSIQATGIQYNASEIADGGVGRYRGILFWNDSCVGHARIKGMVPFFAQTAPKVGTDIYGDVYTGIVADVDPKPSTRPNRKYLGLGRSEFDPGLTGAAANAETLEYYNTVKTGANGTGASITTSLPHLQAFRDRYFKAGVGKELVAKYYNDGDLGVGREMHCNFEIPGERACYVSNFAPCAEALQANGRCAKPIFGNRAGAIAEQNGNKVPFATVAMVERTAIDHTQPNAMFFAVFVCTGSNCNNVSNHTLFNGPVALDNHGVAGQGSNTFNPGNCMACHGTGGSYNKTTNSVTGAYFLPFDMEAFEYLSTSSSSPVSKQGVHDALRAMNKGVAESHLAKVGNAKRMIQVWYDGNGNFATGKFNGARTPSDLGFVSSTVNGATTWQSSGALYNEVYGAACRGCHISHPVLQFSTYAFWQAASALMLDKVCTSKDMPLAERTHDLVWDEPVRQRLLQHLGISTTSCNY